MPTSSAPGRSGSNLPLADVARKFASGSSTRGGPGTSAPRSPGSSDTSRRRPSRRTCANSRASWKRAKRRPRKGSRAAVSPFSTTTERGGVMKALVWHATNDVRVERVPDPKILNPRDAIVKITSSAICGSDLHLLDGFIPTMQTGDILGHEFMGEVVEVGRENRKLKVGDRVVVPFTIACGRCLFSQGQL